LCQRNRNACNYTPGVYEEVRHVVE
jgi:hypothetical protein